MLVDMSIAVEEVKLPSYRPDYPDPRSCKAKYQAIQTSSQAKSVFRSAAIQPCPGDPCHMTKPPNDFEPSCHGSCRGHETRSGGRTTPRSFNLTGTGGAVSEANYLCTVAKTRQKEDYDQRASATVQALLDDRARRNLVVSSAYEYTVK